MAAFLENLVGKVSWVSVIVSSFEFWNSKTQLNPAHLSSIQLEPQFSVSFWPSRVPKTISWAILQILSILMLFKLVQLPIGV